MTVTTINKSHYGMERMYIKDMGLRDAVQTLTRRKTIDDCELVALNYILNYKHDLSGVS